MWVFLPDSFISLVENSEDRSTLLVRTRVRGHIEQNFPTVTVFQKKDADYQFRSVVPRNVVADMMVDQVNSINYGNFKNSVHNDELHMAYQKVWSLMRTLQH